MLTLYENTPGQAQDRDALARSEKKYRRLVEFSGVLMFILDREFTIRFASDNLPEVLHRNPDEVTGSSFFNAFNVAEEGPLALLLEELACLSPYTTGQMEISVTPTAADCERTSCFDLLVTHMLDDAEINGFVLYLHEATRRKQTEAALDCVQAELEGFLYHLLADIRETLLRLLALLDGNPRDCPPDIAGYLDGLSCMVQQLEGLVADLGRPVDALSREAQAHLLLTTVLGWNGSQVNGKR
jgi:PAS domain S-box-containing protein